MPENCTLSFLSVAEIYIGYIFLTCFGLSINLFSFPCFHAGGKEGESVQEQTSGQPHITECLAGESLWLLGRNAL